MCGSGCAFDAQDRVTREARCGSGCALEAQDFVTREWRKTSKRLSRNNIITTGRQNNNSALHYLYWSGEVNAHYVSILVNAKVEVNCRNVDFIWVISLSLPSMKTQKLFVFIIFFRASPQICDRFAALDEATRLADKLLTCSLDSSRLGFKRCAFAFLVACHKSDAFAAVVRKSRALDIIRTLVATRCEVVISDSEHLQELRPVLLLGLAVCTLDDKLLRSVPAMTISALHSTCAVGKKNWAVCGVGKNKHREKNQKARIAAIDQAAKTRCPTSNKQAYVRRVGNYYYICEGGCHSLLAQCCDLDR